MGSMNKELCDKLEGMSSKEFLTIVEGAKDYAMYKGIGMGDLRGQNGGDDARLHLPFCLIPSEFPTERFQQVHNLQMEINLLLHKLSHSKDLLRRCLQNTIEADEFTRNIFDIYEKVCDRQKEQINLGIIRTDYLLSCDSEGRANGIKQVENNTIAVGLGAVSPMLRDLHRYVLKKVGAADYGCNLPTNESCEGIARAMIAAWYAYGRQGAVFLFVVEEWTYNIYDQRMLEYKIMELEGKHEVIRCTFKDLRTCLTVKDEAIFVNGKEVAVVYYRVGYAPHHYKPQDWTTRLVIEKSKAVKCPSVGLHLAGTKRVQLALSCHDDVLESLVNPEVAKKLRKVFAHQYDLSAPNGIINKAVQNPDAFVLKAEREGGGNNKYGTDLKSFLEKSDVDSRKSYILMEKIKSPETRNCIIRPETAKCKTPPQFCSVTNELGIFGVILGSNSRITTNEVVGHLLRSKPSTLNEGGVSTGCGALDYPCLT